MMLFPSFLVNKHDFVCRACKSLRLLLPLLSLVTQASEVLRRDLHDGDAWYSGDASIFLFEFEHALIVVSCNALDAFRALVTNPERLIAEMAKVLSTDEDWRLQLLFDVVGEVLRCLLLAFLVEIVLASGYSAANHA